MVVSYVGFVLFNLYTVFSGLAFVVYDNETQDLLEFELLMPRKFARAQWACCLAVAIFECAMMGGMALFSLFILLKFECSKDADTLLHYRIWHQLYTVCCYMVPVMGNFSAIKSLSVLNPQVISSSFPLALTKVEEGESYLRV